MLAACLPPPLTPPPSLTAPPPRRSLSAWHRSFRIFDDDHNGFLTEEELIQMLKANHMTTEANVLKKAKTIMKQADVDGDGHINLEEFVVISEKFPNILFPPNVGD